MNHDNVVIIGAPRSGTNILRDVLTNFSGFETWPCDEINYIWRHGNVRFHSDELTPAHATQKVSGYICSQFEWLAAHTGAKVVVEKTCANSLRVPFVDSVVPDARYIFIYRDGIDVLGSALKRWTAKLDIPYLLRKARFVPLSDLPYYAGRYFFNRLHKLFSSEQRLAVWGPRVSFMEEWRDQYDLLQICALQWKACIEKADEDLRRLDEGRVFRVRYEDFVIEPEHTVETLLQFIGRDESAGLIREACASVSSASIGKGRTQLGEENLSRVLPLIRESLDRRGYRT